MQMIGIAELKAVVAGVPKMLKGTRHYWLGSSRIDTPESLLKSTIANTRKIQQKEKNLGIVISSMSLSRESLSAIRT